MIFFWLNFKNPSSFDIFKIRYIIVKFFLFFDWFIVIYFIGDKSECVWLDFQLDDLL